VWDNQGEGQEVIAPNCAVHLPATAAAAPAPKANSASLKDLRGR
jgi:hypothetical protein